MDLWEMGMKVERSLKAHEDMASVVGVMKINIYANQASGNMITIELNKHNCDIDEIFSAIADGIRNTTARRKEAVREAIKSKYGGSDGS